MKLSTKEGLKISGKVKINTYRAGMVEAVTPILNQIQELRPLALQFPGILAWLRSELERVKAEFFIRTAAETHNLVMDSPNCGLDIIIQRLVGINTYSLNLAWIEIGTGTTAPNVNDTGLTAPSARIAISYQEDYATTDAIVQAYVADANLPNATYGEVGSFIDGTADIGSGQIFNHALISPAFTKTAGTDVTVEVDITIINS